MGLLYGAEQSQNKPVFSDDGDRYRYKRAERLRVYNGRRRNGHNKKVIIENPDGNAKKPVFIRVAVVPSIKDKQGGYLNKEVAIDPATAFHENWALHDGYYYYKYPVMPGDRTAELFQNSTVTLNCSLRDGEYVQLDVIADTIQATANGDKTEALTTQFAREAWNYDSFILE